MSSMSTLGVIERKRLRSIPRPLRIMHESTFYFHDSVADVFHETEQVADRSFKLTMGDIAAIPAETLRSTHPIEIARLAGRDSEAQRLLLNECVMGLVSDALQFICEGLFAYEKGKLTVSLSLMRKPLKENLLYLEWLLADQDEFYAAFRSPARTKLSIGGLAPERRIEIIRAAVAKVPMESSQDAEFIASLRYDKMIHGLEPLWQKASHLVTTQGANLLTEEENFNFIFASETDREGVYHHIALQYFLLISHFHDVALTALSRLNPVPEGIFQYQDICKLAASTFITNDWRGFRRTFDYVIKSTNETITCACGSKMKLSPQKLARSFLTRSVRCAGCRGMGEFDLYRLMGFDQRTADPRKAA